MLFYLIILNLKRFLIEKASLMWNKESDSTTVVGVDTGVDAWVIVISYIRTVF
jgi:hypothetical protein